jgi:hypothetical protein
VGYRKEKEMKIHRVVQMLGATTSTGKLASDMYDLNYKTYYSEAEDRVIPISHMDFQHLVRSFLKLNEEDIKNRHDNHVKTLYADTRKANDIVSKEAYQVMWDNCKELEKQVKHYKKLAEDNFIASVNDSETSNVWKERYEHELKNAEFWKDTYYNNQPKGCGYVFSEIPNDTDGQEFVDNMKQYFNKKTYKMRVRGQHIKPELKGTGATYFGQNLNESTHMRVYIDIK